MSLDEIPRREKVDRMHERQVGWLICKWCKVSTLSISPSYVYFSQSPSTGGFIMDESMTLIEIMSQARYFRIGSWSFGFSSACQVRGFILPGVFKYNFEACKGLCSHISLLNPRCRFELETVICLIGLKST